MAKPFQIPAGEECAGTVRWHNGFVTNVFKAGNEFVYGVVFDDGDYADYDVDDYHKVDFTKIEWDTTEEYLIPRMLSVSTY